MFKSYSGILERLMTLKHPKWCRLPQENPLRSRLIVEDLSHHFLYDRIPYSNL